MSRYDSLKDYLQINNKTNILQILNEYIKQIRADYILNDITIETVSVTGVMPSDMQHYLDALNGSNYNYFELFDSLNFIIGVSGVSYNCDQKIQDIHYYNMMLVGNLKDRLTSLYSSRIDEVKKEELIKETVLSLFGLPKIGKDNIEEKAKKIYVGFCRFIRINPKHRYWFPIIDVKEKEKMKMWPADLPDNILGQIHFKPSRADIYNPDNMVRPYKNYSIPAGTILLNSKYYKNEMNIYDDVITATHELIHWDHHDAYFQILNLIDGDYSTMNCSAVPLIMDEKMSLREKAFWYAEWQANELAIRVVMPKHLVEKAIEEYNNDESVHNPADEPFSGRYYQNMILKLARDFNVPREKMKVRLRQLGYDFADGALFDPIDGSLYPSFAFAQGFLKEDETFVIDRAKYEKLMLDNKDFAELINSKVCVYTGYVVCVNDTKYIKPDFHHSKLQFTLSKYASEHAEECCIKFELKYKKIISLNPELICTGFLNRLNDNEYLTVNGDLSIEAKNDRNSYHKKIEERRNAKKILSEMDTKNIISFSQALKYHIDECYFKDDLCDENYLKQDTLKKYISEKRKPSREMVMIICNRLKLHHDLSIDLLRRAGYTINLDTKEGELYDYLLTITNATLETWEQYLKEEGFEPLLKNQS